jgi:hypothetical protein
MNHVYLNINTKNLKIKESNRKPILCFPVLNNKKNKIIVLKDKSATIKNHSAFYLTKN